MEKIFGMLLDQNGKLSMMRIMVGYIVVVYMYTWSHLSIAEGNLIAIDWSNASVIIGGLLAKAHQAGNESKG
jgi:hypothetical protein